MNEEKRARLEEDLKSLQAEEALWLGELEQRKEALARQEALDQEEAERKEDEKGEEMTKMILDKEDQDLLDSLSKLSAPKDANEVDLGEDPTSWILPSMGQSVRAAERITQSGEQVATMVIRGGHARCPVPGAKVDPILLLRALTRAGCRRRRRYRPRRDLKISTLRRRG